MRSLINIIPPDIKYEEQKKDIEEITKIFSDYLNDFPFTNSRSKHNLMGPIAKILEMSKNKNYTADYIKAKALRMHEMKKASGFVSSESIKLLEKGVDKLLSFRNQVSEISLYKLLDIIDGQIYFTRRKFNVEKFETIRLDFIEFIQKKYSNIDELVKSWKVDIADWKDIKYPKKKGEYFKNGNAELKKNILEFWQTRKDLENKIVEEEN